MASFYVHTTNEPLWRDAARRLHHSRLVAAAAEAEAEVFDGSTAARPKAVRAALDAGRHAIIAAEPCLSREETTALLEAARARGVTLAFLNPDRFLPSRDLMRKQLTHGDTAGPLGTPELIRSHRWENHVAPAPLGLPGPLVGEIEMAARFFGRPVRTVFALRPTGFSAWQVHLGFEPGMAVIDYCDALQGTTAEGYRSLSIIGSRGATQIDDHNNTQLAYVGGSGATGVTVGEGVLHLTSLLELMGVNIRSKILSNVSATQALEIVDVVEAVKKSLANGDAVTLPTAEAVQ